MANKVGASLATQGLLTDIDTVQRNELGCRVQDENGGEYIYLPGVASLVAGDWVMFGNNLTYVPTRMLNDANSGGAGLAAVAMAAILAANWGWFQVYGLGTVQNANVATNSSIGVALYRSGTTARASTSSNAKDSIFGAYTVAAGASNLQQVFLNWPHVQDQSTL